MQNAFDNIANNNIQLAAGNGQTALFNHIFLQSYYKYVFMIFRFPCNEI